MTSIEEILNFVESLVYTQTGENLNDLQRTILQQCWEDKKKTYDSIAIEQGYSANYIKQGVAPKLWRLLSKAFGEKLTKSNIHSVIERKITAQTSTQDNSFYPISSDQVEQLPSPFNFRITFR